MDEVQLAQAETAEEPETGADAEDHGQEPAAEAQGEDAAAPEHGEGDLIAEVEHDLDEGGDHHDEPFLSPELLLVLALVVLFAILWKPAKKAILGGLDSRAERIRNELEEANRLKEEAQAALATFQRKQRDAMQEAEQIVEHARQDAVRLRAQAAESLEEQLARREQQAMDRIANAERSAAAEVRGAAVDLAVAAAAKLIAEQVDEAKSAALIDEAIADLPKRLH